MGKMGATTVDATRRRNLRFRPRAVSARRPPTPRTPPVLVRSCPGPEADDGPSLAEAVRERRRSVYERFAKPVGDRVVAVVLLVVALPIMALVAVLVLIRLGRPVLYVQYRVGKDDTPFRMLKFRTMGADRRGQSDPTEYGGPDRR